MYHHLITRLTWIPFPFVMYAYLFRTSLVFYQRIGNRFSPPPDLLFLFSPIRIRLPHASTFIDPRNDKKEFFRKQQKKAMINKLWIIVVRSNVKRGKECEEAERWSCDVRWRGGKAKEPGKNVFLSFVIVFLLPLFRYSFYLWLNACGIFYAVFRDRSECYIKNNA